MRLVLLEWKFLSRVAKKFGQGCLVPSDNHRWTMQGWPPPTYPHAASEDLSRGLDLGQT